MLQVCTLLHFILLHGGGNYFLGFLLRCILFYFFQHWLSMLDVILSLSPPSLNSSLLEPLMFLESESESHSVMSDSLQSQRLYSPCNSPGQNTGVGSLSLLQGIFSTQESNWGLLNCRQILYQLIYQGCPIFLIQS